MHVFYQAVLLMWSLQKPFHLIFKRKFEALHKSFQNSATVPDLPEDRTDVLIMVKLSEFRIVSQDDVDNTIKQSNGSLCLLDSVPAWLLKSALESYRH